MDKRKKDYNNFWCVFAGKRKRKKGIVMKKRFLAAILIASMVFNSSGVSSAYAAEYYNPAVESSVSSQEVEMDNEITDEEEKVLESETEVEEAVTDDTEVKVEADSVQEESTENAAEDENAAEEEEEILVESEEEMVSEEALAAIEIEIETEGFCGNDEDGENVSWRLVANEDGEKFGLNYTFYTLVIEGEGDMADEKKFASAMPWYTFYSFITQVEVGEGVTSVSQRAFYGLSNLMEVSLPDSLEILETEAFRGCKNLEEITIPDNVVAINASTFEGCSKLTKVTLGSGIEYINKRAFFGCGNLAEINIPDSVTAISEEAFYECKSITSLNLSGDIKSIGKSAFKDCTGLTEVNISDSLIVIGDYAFMSCKSLASVSLPDVLTEIGIQAFADCTSLKEITIPEAVEDINKLAFSGDVALEKVSFAGGNASIASDAFEECENISEVHANIVEDWCNIAFANEKANPVFFAKNLYVDGEILTKLEIPEGISTINDYSFYNCESLTDIVLGDDVTRIGNYAFRNVKNVDHIFIPATVETIAGYYSAFDGWKSGSRICCEPETKPVNWGSGWAKNPKYGYSYDEYEYWVLNPSDEKDLVIPDGIRFIPSFGIQSEIESIYIPESVKRIEDGAFSGCSSLKKICIDSLENWCDIDFEYSSANPLSTGAGLYLGDDTEAVSVIEIPDSVTKIGRYAFCSNDSITEIVLHDNVSSIGERAFYNLNNMHAIFIPANAINHIGDYAFCTASSLVIYSDAKYATGYSLYSNWDDRKYDNVPIHFGYTRDMYEIWKGMDPSKSIIEIPEVDEIPANMFEGFDKLASVSIPATVEVIGEEAFKDCNALESVRFANEALTEIGSSAFIGCTALKEVEIPECVTDIAESAFSGCTALTDVVINGQLINISKNMFDGCENLKNVTLPDSVTNIGIKAFADCSSLEKINMPADLESISSNAFENCESLGEIVFNEALETIGTYAFSCAGVTKVTFDANLANVEEGAFSGCDNLVSLDMNGVEVALKASAFADCTSLENIEWSESLVSIGQETFAGCTALEEVVLPADLAEIGNQAFNGCTSLVSVTLPDSLEVIPKLCFAGCSDLENITWGEMNNTIDRKAFSGCSSLRKIEIGASIENVGEYAFEDCVALNEVSFEENSVLATISTGAFYGCDYLVDVTIPDGVSTIGAKAFENCGELRSIYIPESVENMAAATATDSPFYGCDATTMLYCAAEADAIPEGWGKYWNYCSEDQALMVFYGYSREQFLIDKEFDARDTEDFMLHGKIDLSKLWTTDTRSLVITKEGYYIGDPEDSQNAVKIFEGTDPIILFGEVKDPHNNSIVVIGDDTEREIVLEDVRYTNTDGERYPFITGDGHITLKINGKAVINNVSVKDVLTADTASYDFPIKIDHLTLTGAGDLITNDDAHPNSPFIHCEILDTEDYTGDIDLNLNHQFCYNFKEVSLKTTGDINISTGHFSPSVFYTPEPYYYDQTPVEKGDVTLEANNILVSCKEAEDTSYSYSSPFLCYVPGDVKVISNNKILLGSTGIDAASLFIEAGEDGIEIINAYTSSNGNMFFDCEPLRENHTMPYSINDGDEQIDTEVNAVIISGGDLTFRMPVNQNRYRGLVSGAFVMDIAGDLIVDVNASYLFGSYGEYSAINVGGDAIFGSEWETEENNELNRHYFAVHSSGNGVKKILYNIGGKLDVKTLASGGPLFTGNGELSINAGEYVTFDCKGAFISYIAMTIETPGDISALNTRGYSTGSDGTLISHNGSIIFDDGGHYYGSQPVFGGETVLQAQKDIIMKQQGYLFYGKSATVTANTGDFIFKGEYAVPTSQGPVSITAAGKVEFDAKTLQFGGGLTVKADDVRFSAPESGTPLFMGNVMDIESNNDVVIDHGFMIISGVNDTSISAGGKVDLHGRKTNGAPLLSSASIKIDAKEDVSIKNDTGFVSSANELDISSGGKTTIAGNTGSPLLSTTSTTIKSKGDVAITNESGFISSGQDLKVTTDGNVDFKGNFNGPLITTNLELDSKKNVNLINDNGFISYGGELDISSNGYINLEGSYSGSPLIQSKEVELEAVKDINISNDKGFIANSGNFNVKTAGNITLSADLSKNIPLVSAPATMEGIDLNYSLEAGNKLVLENVSDDENADVWVAAPINIVARELEEVCGGEIVESSKWKNYAGKTMVPLNRVNAILIGDNPKNFELTVSYEGYTLIQGVDYDIVIEYKEDLEGNVIEPKTISFISLIAVEGGNSASEYMFTGKYRGNDSKTVSPLVLKDEETELTTEEEYLKLSALNEHNNALLANNGYRERFADLEARYMVENEINLNDPVVIISNSAKALNINKLDIVGLAFAIEPKSYWHKDAEMLDENEHIRTISASVDTSSDLEVDNEKYENAIGLKFTLNANDCAHSYRNPYVLLSFPLPKGIDTENTIVVNSQGYRSGYGYSGSIPYVYDKKTNTISICVVTYFNYDPDYPDTSNDTFDVVIANKKKAPDRVMVSLNPGVKADLLSEAIGDGYIATVGKPYGNLPVLMMADEDDESVFLGWYTALADGVEVTADTIVTNTNNHTLYARWEKGAVKELNVNYEPAEGVMPEGDYPVTFKYRGVFNSLPVPEREDYEFIGWFDSPMDGNLVENGMIVKATGYLTLYAYWKSAAVDVAKPEAVLLGGSGAEVCEGDMVQLITSTVGAEIRYTLDGTDPREESESVKVYSEPIEIKEDLANPETKAITIKAYAVVKKWSSSVSEFEYTYVIPEVDEEEADAIASDLAEAGLDKIPEGLWIAGIPESVVYNGANQIFDVRVYYRENRLTVNKDYSIVYANNKNAGTAKITITGKGSFAGKQERTFTIEPISLGEEVNGEIINNPNVNVEDVILSYTGTVQKPKQTVTYSVGEGRKDLVLRVQSDFKFVYDNAPGAYKDVTDEDSKYIVEIAGCGKNFVGKAAFGVEITNNVLVKTLVASIKNCEYNYANPGEPVYPEVIVKDKKKNQILNGYLAKDAVSATEAEADYSSREDVETEYDFIYYLTDNINTGVGNVIIIGNKEAGYAGKTTKTFKILGRSINKATYASELTKSYSWTGEQISPVIESGENASVKFGVDKEILLGVEKHTYESMKAAGDEDANKYAYTYEYSTEDRISLGTVAITFNGINGYNGTVIKKFKIIGTSIRNSNISIKPFERVVYGFEPTDGYVVPDGSQGDEEATVRKIIAKEIVGRTYVYTYEALKGITPQEYSKLSDSEKMEYDYLYEYVDYDLYNKRRVVFTGINGYYGTYTMKPTVDKVDIKKDQDKALSEEEEQEDPRLVIAEIGEVEYVKGGPKPDVSIYDTVTKKYLVKDVDYKLTYSNINQTYRSYYYYYGYYDYYERNKQATVTIRGIGYYEGSVNRKFTITEKNVSDVTLTANDTTAFNKGGINKPVVTLTDVNGSKLVVNKDYKILSYQYTEETWVSQLVNKQYTAIKRDAGEEIDKNDIIPAGTVVKVTIEGVDWYTTGSKTSTTFKIAKSMINTAKASVKAQSYTGRPIYPKKSDITISIGGVALTADDYDIIEYSNNVEKGKGKLVIRGRGVYGGTKTLIFNIDSYRIDY